MTRPISDIAFTPAVKQAQQDRGSRGTYAKVEQRGGWGDRVIPDLAAFIAEHDSLYLGTANVDGQPYIQHRGGTKGFLKVLDERTLALADFSGNRQYISLGNLSENNKAFIFLMDYPNRRRIKIWGTARFVEDDPALLARVVDQSYQAEPERALVFTIEAWDTNCRSTSRRGSSTGRRRPRRNGCATTSSSSSERTPGSSGSRNTQQRREGQKGGRAC